ncbi:amino acid permease [Mesorhizobium sp. SARCC-RB16n]|uniref:APC family permease n=1 Tax=Mesorhizobium sp. SARCC-RB16n TaxID=2116687 RepID=UPI00122ECD06|nr:APC family permease [Mesorhizobium sp. SARCC-RB16n]KAA3441979.1 amino acid permease [Mesorhizobium sp. SARCC-RB16n]
MTQHVQGGALSGNLSTLKVVAMVVAAAAPLGAVLGMVPLTLFLGAGASTPVMYVFAGIILLLFSVGYAAISQHVSGAGGFYDYIARGLGRTSASGAGLVAVVAYNAMTLALVSGVGYFASLNMHDMAGIDVPWWLFAFVSTAIIAVLGYRSAELAGSILRILIALELGILLVLVLAIIAQKGAAAFPLVSLDPTAIFTTGSVGLGLMFALSSFIGFESAAIYAEETADPQKSIPQATYLTVIVVSLFFALVSWVTIGALGIDKAADVAKDMQGGVYFMLSDQFVGKGLSVVLSLTVVTSLFASQLALHNAASRYMYAIGRERLLPHWLGHAHPVRKTPSRASLVQTAITVVAIIFYAGLGLDPYLQMTTSMIGLGTLGIFILQAAASIAIVSYFWKHGAAAKSMVIIGPAIAAVALIVASALTIQNFKVLTGATSDAIYIVPFVLLAVALFGAAYALWLRSNRPTIYAAIGTFSDIDAIPEH